MIQYLYRYLGEDEQSVNSQLSKAGHGPSVQKREELWHRTMRVAPQPPDNIVRLFALHEKAEEWMAFRL